ncbi:VCBS domain-containing protein, partial [Vibrio sp. qd031]|uniref:VCBS domain-containing protein n=1 Tax=Vibrio sp. qd031 TaxID=1603038 RepID=UPI0018D41951
MEEQAINLDIFRSGNKIIIDANGNSKVVPIEYELQPGEVVVQVGDSPISVDDLTLENLSVSFFKVENDEVAREVKLDDDIAAIFEALEEGQDPTLLGEEFETAAGESTAGSSLSTSGTIARDNAEVIAATVFNTDGLTPAQQKEVLSVFEYIVTNESTVDPLPQVTISIDLNDPAEVRVFGQSENAETITVVIGGEEHLVTPNPDGSWELLLPPLDLADGEYVAEATAESPSGKEATADTSFILDMAKPVVSIDPPSDTSDTTPTFTGGSDNTDGPLTVIVNDKEYEVIPDDNGDWELTLPPEDALEDGDYDIVVVGKDNQGNSAEDESDLTIDTTAPSAPVVTIVEDLNNDGQIPADEIDGQINVIVDISGTGATIGDTVTINGTDYEVTQDVLDLGTIELEIAVPQRGETVTVEAVIKDKVGNVSEPGQDSAELVNTGPVAEDDVVTTDEDTAVTIDVLANDSDIDNDDITIIDATVPASQGTIEIVNNQLIFTPAPDFNGDASISYTISDGQGGTDTAQVVVEVAPVDDAPIISDDLGSTTEGDVTPVTGELTATDVDNPDLLFVANAVNDAYGDFTIDSNGQWSFVLSDNSTVNALADGEVVEREFEVTLTDGSVTTVTITITGTDDAPVISTGEGAVTEGDSIPVVGTLIGTDADNPELSFVESTVADSYGDFTVDADGNWTFTLANSATVAALAEGESTVRDFVVTLSDGSSTTVTITITGTDDLPVVSIGTGATTEGDSTPVVGTLTATDADNTDLAFEADSVTDLYGDFTVDVDGNWTFTLADNETVNALAEGQVVDRVFTVDLSDGSTTTVTISITGTDDDPVISADTDAVIEGDLTPVSGTLTATDADNPDLEFAPNTITDAYGEFTVDAEGNWTFTLADNATVDALTAGQKEVREFTVTLSDGSNTTVTITITGTDDAPVISADTDAVTEGDVTPVSGTLTATDADNPDLAFNSNTISDAYGEFTVDAEGNWTFTLADNATVDALTAGQKEVREFTVTLSDGSDTTVTITI